MFTLNINFIKNENPFNHKEKKTLLFNILKNKLNCLTNLYIIFEENKKKEDHLHGVIVVKNITDFNINLKNNIMNTLKDIYELDVVVKHANTFLDVKNWITHYMWKDVDNWQIPSKLWFLKKDQQIYADFLDLAHYELEDTNFKTETAGFSYEELELNEFNGCKIIKNSLEKETIIDLALYYIMFNKLYIYKNHIYRKIDNSLISYEKIDTVKNEIYNNFKEKVIPFFIKKFPLHFTNFDFYSLIKKYLKTNEKLIEEIWDLTSNRIEPDFSLLEFKDGVYSIKYNKFIPKKFSNKFPKEFATIKYYNKTFKHLGEPQRWIKDICKALNCNEKEFEKNEIFLELCCYIANIFHKNKIYFSKKRVLYIHGDSNTKKSTLIAKPLVGYFGIENVGFISESKNFKFQHLSGKKVGIIDEFKYDPNFAQEYLKLFAGEVTVTEKKYAKDHKIIEDLPIIILSNNLINEKDKKISEALFNRIFTVEFKKTLESQNKEEKIDTTKIDKQIDDILKEEEPKIIKFCNKIFYETKYKTKTRVDTPKLIESLKTDILNERTD